MRGLRADTLGFDAIDSVIASGQTEKSDIDSGRKTFLVEINNGGFTTGAQERPTIFPLTEGLRG